MNPLRIYLGYDPREDDAYRVAEHSLRKHASVPVSVTPLDADKLAACGLLRRPADKRGRIYDIHSNAFASTEFHASRFLVPHLAQSGFALFVDSDVVFLGDVAEIFDQADYDKAVMVVKHKHEGAGMKMDGQVQQAYSRKNWSSVMLINADHPANRRLSLQDVNERPGRDLHSFFWLHDSEIGNLTMTSNWLVGIQEKPLFPLVAHFTLGTPNLTPALADCEHAKIWWDAYRECMAR